MKYLLLLAFIISSHAALANGKKIPPALISFHLEGIAAEAPKFAQPAITLAGKGYFRIVPEISNKDIIAFSPFPSPDEPNSYGIVFQIKPVAGKRLERVSTINQGKLLLAKVNGEPHDVVRIDRPITDSKLVIWRGLTLEQIRLYDHIVPRIGETKEEWKKKVKALKKEKR